MKPLITYGSILVAVSLLNATHGTHSAVAGIGSVAVVILAAYLSGK